MKIPARHAFLALLLGTATGALYAADKPVPADSPVKVVFDHPENYTDLKDSGMDMDNARGREYFLPLLKEHLEKEAGRRLAPGQKLIITFTDIDLAGDFEPWRGPQLSDVRIVKEIYLPRLKLTFQLTDADGRVSKEGERKLTDLAYQMRITRAFRDDPLRYEKDILDDWLQLEFAARKD
ncbi:MAG: DUF3016 domain-containing protein [bacterium]|nr:DUF3016 domain-containing protein [bacterium]MDI1337004.1 DUF3016 domain-containing protein [Lacunisphaera sp.]